MKFDDRLNMLIFIFLGMLLLPISVEAKRSAPININPIEYKDIIIKIPHWKFQQIEKIQNGCVIEIWNLKENKYIKTIVLKIIEYKPRKNSGIETDNQDVFVGWVDYKKTLDRFDFKLENGETISVFGNDMLN